MLGSVGFLTSSVSFDMGVVIVASTSARVGVPLLLAIIQKDLMEMMGVVKGSRGLIRGGQGLHGALVWATGGPVLPTGRVLADCSVGMSFLESVVTSATFMDMVNKTQHIFHVVVSPTGFDRTNRTNGDAYAILSIMNPVH